MTTAGCTRPRNGSAPRLIRFARRCGQGRRDAGGPHAEWNTILAIAALNREYRTATALKDDQAKGLRDAGYPAADAIAAARIRGAAGQMFGVSDLAELGIDTTENWLFDAAKSTGTNAATGDLARVAIMGTQSYSLRKSLKSAEDLEAKSPQKGTGWLNQ